MEVIYRNCEPLDQIGEVDHAFFRLTFLPENRVLPDAWAQGAFSENMVEQLGRIGDTPYFFPSQGQPTIINDPDKGRAGVIDVMPRSDWTGCALQTALQAIEDSYAHAKLYACERHDPYTGETAGDVATQQAATATTAATVQAATTPQAKIATAFKWGVVALVVIVVGIVVWKAPRAGGS